MSFYGEIHNTLLHCLIQVLLKKNWLLDLDQKCTIWKYYEVFSLKKEKKKEISSQRTQF